MFAPDSGQARLGSGTGEIARHLVEPSAVGEDGNGAHVINLVRQARERWLKNTEVCDILINYRQYGCLLYTSPSPRDGLLSRMPSSA